MKKLLIIIPILFFLAQRAIATISDNQEAQNKIFYKYALGFEIEKLKNGLPISFPLNDGDIIQCYAKRTKGNVDRFQQYNDYFIMRRNNLYSNTFYRMYQPGMAEKLNKIDNFKLLDNEKILSIEESIWEKSGRRHERTIKINVKTGEYFMKIIQDNSMWYKHGEAKGFCRIISNK